MVNVANDTYSPGYLVRQTHDILHLDSSLHKVSSTFLISYHDYDNDYSRSSFPIPIICCTLGIVAIVVLQISLCARLCLKACRCLPNVATSDQTNSEAIRKARNPRYNLLLYIFVASALLTFAVDQ